MPSDGFPILRTKLHRPRPAPDAISRPRLIELLNRGLELPLTIVSVSAGFGKSTLVSQWVGGLDPIWKAGWYSIDESDNDLRSFLRYLVSAVRSAVPNSCPATKELIELESLPSAADLLRELSNDLSDLESDLVLVLDDFHRIEDPAIHEFLDSLLARPPAGLRLVIITRRDPALSLSRLRVSGTLNDLRLRELRFNDEEVQDYLTKALASEVPPELTEVACGHIEGWPVALRMLVLSLRGAGSIREITEQLPSVPARLSSYLIAGILDGLEPDYLEAVLKISILDRFCAGLCEAVIPSLDSEVFLQWMIDSNLFVINLDESGSWFRYHHLFQEALQQILVERYDEKEVSGVQLRVAEWFGAKGFLDDAIAYALKAGEETRAGEFMAIVCRNAGRTGDESGQEDLIERLPEEVIQQSPTLLVGWAWQRMSQSKDWQEAILRAEESLRGVDLEPAEEGWLRGSVACLKCFSSYRDRDFPKVLEMGEEARRTLPLEYANLRTSPYVVGSLAHRSMGDGAAAQGLIGEGCAEFAKDPNSLAYMLSADAQGYLMVSDMPGLKSSAQYCFEHCQKHHQLWIGGIARNLTGRACYQLNDLRAAEDFLSFGESERIRMGFKSHLWCRGNLVRTLAAAQRWDDAENLLETLRDELRVHPNSAWSALIDGLHAEIALGQGHASRAIAWVKESAPPASKVQLAQITSAAVYVRALLAWGTEKAREDAANFLAVIIADADLMRFNESRIQFRILQALWHQQRGGEDAALGTLGEAVKIALPGGALRLFADFGAELVPLLQRLELDAEGVEYVGRIMGVIAGPSGEGPGESIQTAPPSSGGLIDALSKREFEVLRHLSQRLSNNEIAERLFISPVTVKRHLSNIYEKLAVHGRKEAVAKAVGLGLLKN